jgi:hypothetical protein
LPGLISGENEVSLASGPGRRAVTGPARTTYGGAVTSYVRPLFWLVSERAEPDQDPRQGRHGPAQLAEPLARPDDDHTETALKIAECDRKLTGYRAALDAGASPATVVACIADTEAEKARYLAVRRPSSSARRRRMSEAEIEAIVDRLANLARALADADPNDKSEIFRQLGLRLTYHPASGLVEAQVMPAECVFFEGVRGPGPTNCAR